ncbi:MAG TPA: hypothetical protein VEV84_00240 [Pyrinomonadaceae bacterium]|jgi:hypothetical protein|nr:hypothetical protein [Pyrinomonadaceae bacterium]
MTLGWNAKSDLLTIAIRNDKEPGILLSSLKDGKVQTLDNVDVGRIGGICMVTRRKSLDVLSGI